MTSNPSNPLLQELVQTREIRQLIAGAVPQVLNVWAGKNSFKKSISRLVGAHIRSSFSSSQALQEASELQQLLADPRFVKELGEQIPGLLGTLGMAFDGCTKTIEQMPLARQKKLFAGMLTGNGEGNLGALLTTWARIINQIHQDEPRFLVDLLEPGLRKWVADLDFGELKELAENASETMGALVELANEVMWEYPAKVMLLLSLIPTVANTLAKLLDISLEKLNEVPPDLLTDIITSFVREIDAQTIAQLTNQLTEVVRKVHTGSALLGEVGTPRLEQMIAEKLGEVISGTDAVNYHKARLALARIKASAARALEDAAAQKPDNFKLISTNEPELVNIVNRTRNHKLSLWQDMDDQELTRHGAERLGAYDLQEAAEVVNNLVALANRQWERNPESCEQFVGQFTNALDHYELGEFAKKIMANPGGEVQAAARATVPSLVIWVCGVLQPQDDEYEEDAAAARQALAALLQAKEV